MAAFQQTIARESDRFLDAVLAAAPSARVPSCPDWTADDLLWHLTEVHGFWAEVLRRGATTDEDVEAIEQDKAPRPESRTELVDRFRTHTAALLDQLERTEDATHAWFWLDTDQTVGATRRMQAHEATFHRIDAELTSGLDPTPIVPPIADDAVSHAMEVMWAWWGTQPGFQFLPTGCVELVASDTGTRWMVEPGRWLGSGQSGTAYDEPGVRLTEGASPAASVRGTADELARWLWGRGPEPRLEGDEAVVGALRDARDAGMN